MTTGYLWDSEVWGFITQFAILLLSILLGNALVRKIEVLRKSLLPSAVVGGLILMLLQFIPFFERTIDRGFMESVTFHMLGLGFVALTLRKITTPRKDDEGEMILKAGMLTVATYLIQGILGITITIILSLTLMESLFPAGGLLAAIGLGQGTGQALNFGAIYQALGFENGVSFALSIAAIGFLFACIGGALAQSLFRKKGIIPAKSVAINPVEEIELPTSDEITLTDSVDKFTIQVALVFGLYFIGFLLMLGISTFGVNYLGDFGVNTLRPTIFGFNFLFAVLVASLFKKLMSFLKNKNIVEKDYTNNFMLTRMSGTFFDIMIISGIAAIDLRTLADLWIVLMIVCFVCGAATFIYLRLLSKTVFKEYSEEGFFAMYGKLTGKLGTGIILLREMDPKLETPVARILILQAMPAMLFGFPLLLLIPFAGHGLNQAIIVLGVCILMFIIINILIFYKRSPNKQISNK